MPSLPPLRTRSFEIATLTNLITQLNSIHTVLAQSNGPVEQWKLEQNVEFSSSRKNFKSFISMVTATLTAWKACLESETSMSKELLVDDLYMEGLNVDLINHLNLFSSVCPSTNEPGTEQIRFHFAVVNRNLNYLCSMFEKTVKHYLSHKLLTDDSKAPIPQTQYIEEPVTIGTSPLSADQGFTWLKVESSDIPGVNVIKITSKFGFKELFDKFESEDLFSVFKAHNVIAIYYNWKQLSGFELDSDACKAMDDIYEKYGIEFSDVERSLSTSLFGGLVARIEIA